MKNKIYRPDHKGRISLGKLAKNVDVFLVELQQDYSIKLTPMVHSSKLKKYLKPVKK